MKIEGTPTSKRCIAQYGATIDSVVEEVLFVTDMEAAFSARAKCREDVFPGNPRLASTIVQVERLAPSVHGRDQVHARGLSGIYFTSLFFAACRENFAGSSLRPNKTNGVGLAPALRPRLPGARLD